jgi:hypothetical protein
MARTDSGTQTPDSLLIVASALQAIASRLTKTAESMKEKAVASLEVKNQAGLRTGLSSLRSFGMTAEEAFEECLFDQNVFKAEGQLAAVEAPKAKAELAGRKAKKQQEPKAETETA